MVPRILSTRFLACSCRASKNDSIYIFGSFRLGDHRVCCLHSLPVATRWYVWLCRRLGMPNLVCFLGNINQPPGIIRKDLFSILPLCSLHPNKGEPMIPSPRTNAHERGIRPTVTKDGCSSSRTRLYRSLWYARFLKTGRCTHRWHPAIPFIYQQVSWQQWSETKWSSRGSTRCRPQRVAALHLFIWPMLLVPNTHHPFGDWDVVCFAHAGPGILRGGLPPSTDRKDMTVWSSVISFEIKTTVQFPILCTVQRSQGQPSMGRLCPASPSTLFWSRLDDRILGRNNARAASSWTVASQQWNDHLQGELATRAAVQVLDYLLSTRPSSLFTK